MAWMENDCTTDENGGSGADGESTGDDGNEGAATLLALSLPGAVRYNRLIHVARDDE
jgi:hypothetical protein